MKLASTNQQINFLICAKTCKNASLSNGAKMTELKNLRNEALKGTGLATSWDDEGGEALEPVSKKIRKVQTTVTIDVHGVAVKLLCPAKRALVADLQVLLDEDMLSAVFKYIQPDCLEKPASRQYKKSGNYSKVKEGQEKKDDS